MRMRDLEKSNTVLIVLARLVLVDCDRMTLERDARD